MNRYFIDIYRNAGVLASAEIFSDTVFADSLNGENRITAIFHSDVAIPLMRNDYILHEDKRYQILDFVDQSISHKYVYQATLLWSSASLLNKPYTNAADQSTFTVTATVTQHLSSVVAKINTFNPGWTVGHVDDDGELKTIQYIGDNCMTALGRIMSECKMEVAYVLKEISLYKSFILPDEPIEISYGMNNGADSIGKRVSGEFFTRVKGYGSSENLPANYRGGQERLTFDPGYADIADAASFVEQKEIEVVFADVKPTRTGSISSVTTSSDESLLADTTIDFNLSDNFITGTTPSIVMQSGHWTGSQFDIIDGSYNDTNKSFKIRPNKEGGFSYPSTTLPIQVGDTYKFIGINLPQSYVTAAEAIVKTLTQEYAATKPVLDVVITLDLDPIYVLENGLVGKLKVGQKVHVTNAPSGINVNMKIVSVTYPLIAPENAVIVISDKVQYSEEEQIQRIVIESVKQSQVIKENIVEVKAFTSRRLDENQAMVFDPQGNYYSEKIKPLSIETLQLTVGSRTQLFTLSVVVKQNYLGSPSQFGWDAGKLVHYTVIPGSTYTWDIPSGTIIGLVGSSDYYIYARCNKANNNGVIVLDTTARQIESDSTYYYFLIGTLNSVIDNVRAISLSYGIAEVNGKFIKGVLTSDDGYSTLDLNTGKFQGRVEFLDPETGLYKDANVLNAETLQALTRATDAKTKTDLLKSLAYEDVVEIAKLGTTVIQGGYIKTTLLDAAYIRSNIINADYIETLEINAVRGTIGGININNSSISSDNGNFSVDGAGQLVAKSGSFGNILIEADRIRSSNNKFILTDAGALTAVDATITGDFKTGATGVRAEMNSGGIVFTNASGHTVDMSGNGPNGVGININAGGINSWMGALGISTPHLSVSSGVGNNATVSATGSFFPLGIGTTDGGGSAVFGINKVVTISSGKTLTFCNGIIVAQTGF